jgi:hypothetical protein
MAVDHLIRAMSRQFLLLCLAVLILASGCADNRPVKVYKFIDAVKQADFDYLMLKNIDKVPTPYPPGGAYQIGDLPIAAGESTLYKFRAEYKGRSAENGQMRFHDILVVKVDARGKVADAFHYTLEWADNPSLDLFRARKTGFALENGVTIDRFGFPFKERGVVELYQRNEATVFLATLKDLIRWDNRPAIAKLVRFPLDLNQGRQTVKIKNKAEFLARYQEIFSPELKSRVLEQQPEEIYSDQRGYMIGNGKLWFDDWGQGLQINTITR